MATKGLKVKVTAEDKATKKITKGFGDIEHKSKSLSKSAAMVNRSFGGMTKLIAGAAGAWLSFQGVMKTKDMIVAGAQIQQTTDAFERLAGVAGVSSDKILRDLKALSGGAVSDFNLMQAAARSSLLGIGFEDQTKLMEIARATSRATGQTVTKAFDDITLAVGRGSKMILDNLGIILSVEDANEAYAKQLGKTATNLTDAERKQAFMNATLKAGAVHVKNLGVESKSAAEELASTAAEMQNAFDNLKVNLSKELLPVVVDVASDFNNWYKTNEGLIGQEMSAWIGGIESSVRSLTTALKEAKSGISEFNKISQGVYSGDNKFLEWASKQRKLKLETEDAMAETAMKINTSSVQNEILKTEDAIDAAIKKIERLKKVSKSWYRLPGEKSSALEDIKHQYSEIERLEKELSEQKIELEVTTSLSMIPDIPKLKPQKLLIIDRSEEISEQVKGLREYEAVLKRITEEGKSGTGFGAMDRWQKDDINQDDSDERTQAILDRLEIEKESNEQAIQEQADMLDTMRATQSAYWDDHFNQLDEAEAKKRAYRELALQEEAAAAEAFKNNWGQSIESIQTNFASLATDGFMDFAEGTKSASEAFDDFAKSFLKNIAKMIIQNRY